MIENVLNKQWTLSDGSEGAIAIEALAMLRQLNNTSREQARFDDLRGRLELRMEQLYWTRLWENEWRDLLQDSRKSGEGSLFWTVSENAIWAKTTWNGDVYLFGIDKQKTFDSMKQDLLFEEEDGRPELTSSLLIPGAVDPDNLIVRRYMPWLEDGLWRLVSFPQSNTKSSSLLKKIVV